MKIRPDVVKKLNDLEWRRFCGRLADYCIEHDFPKGSHTTSRDNLMVKIEEARKLAFQSRLYSEFSVAMYFVLWSETDTDFMNTQEVADYVFLDDQGVEERLEHLVMLLFDEEEKKGLLQQLIDDGELNLATEMARDENFSEVNKTEEL
jgi:hypothetical protein